MAIDYWYNVVSEDAPNIHVVSDHHLVIVPDQHLYTTMMSSDLNYQGGYIGSELKNGLGQAERIVTALFGENHVLSHRECFTNTKFRQSGIIWCDSTVDLMNEPMVFGSYMQQAISGTSAEEHAGLFTIDLNQLPGFYLCQEIKNVNRWHWWLRDALGNSLFAMVGQDRGCSYGHPRNHGGIRPSFGLIG